MGEWNSVYWHTERDKLIELSFIDEADSYEVDQAMIGLDKQTGKFVLIVASGCSCWDDEAEMKSFDTLDELEIEMNKVIDEELIKFPRMREYDKVSNFYLSINGCKELMNEARMKFTDYCIRSFDDTNRSS